MSLEIKQLTDNPWDSIKENIKVDDKIVGKVISMNDNNLHLIINNQYDGNISLSELSFKKASHSSKIINLNDEIEVLVIDIDEEKKGSIAVTKK